MSEIQSAEDTIKKLRGECMVYKNPESDFYDLCRVVDTNDAITLLRARDKAFAERYKKAVHNITTKKKMSGDASWGWMEARFTAETAIDDVLRELGGEQ